MSLVRLVMAAALALWAMPAIAQQETGTRIGGRPAKDPNYGTKTFRARMWLQDYAVCVFGRDPKRVSDMLDSPIATEVAPFRLTERGFDECLSSGGTADELVMSDTLFLGALYSARVKRTIKSLPATKLPAGLLDFPAMDGLAGSAQARIVLVRFGECVMRQHPEEALSFVTADAGSSQETNALGVLSPALGACVQQGTTIELSRSMLEAAIAEAIYRTARTLEAAK